MNSVKVEQAKAGNCPHQSKIKTFFAYFLTAGTYYTL